MIQASWWSLRALGHLLVLCGQILLVVTLPYRTYVIWVHRPVMFEMVSVDYFKIYTDHARIQASWWVLRALGHLLVL